MYPVVFDFTSMIDVLSKKKLTNVCTYIDLWCILFNNLNKFVPQMFTALQLWLNIRLLFCLSLVFLLVTPASVMRQESRSLRGLKKYIYAFTRPN